MQRRWSAAKYREKKVKSQAHPSTENCDKLEGSRIINLDKLQQYVNELTTHAAKCGSQIILSGEQKSGLASIISSHCSKCSFIIPLTTSNKVSGPKGISRWEINLAAVWGQMCTGGGHSKLKDNMSILGVPVMSPKNFINTERSIGQWWQNQLQDEMKEAGQEEKRLAIQRGDYHEGVPAITVIVDAGWSKRSHKHTYNAKSGVGVIIGKETGKILFIGVRNKYCTACSRGISKDKHHCFKNWNDSSSQMESDIILEGFCQAEEVHGVRYVQFIGDGDSSVYPTLLQQVPGWGRYIEKLECANHSCKCYRSALEKLVQEKPHYKGKGGLTGAMRQRLTSAARCAIRMRSQETDVKKAVKKLKQDLKNGPFHCFGVHTKCSPDFCQKAKEKLSEEHQESIGNEDVCEEFSDLIEGTCN